MNSRYTIAVLILIIAGLLLFYISSTGDDSGQISYITDEVILGDISSTVTANGKVRPRERVEIRSNIDGTVKEVFAEINAEVGKGQILATLNDTLYNTRLKEATSKFNRAENELKIKKNLLESDKVLYDKELISNQEYQESVSQYRSALASYEESRAALEIARINMDATKIRSSIDGIVLSKNINAGQTVSATEQTDPLIVIVSKLDKMHLVSDVSESDISEVEVGQKVRFRVSAYPEKTFEGEVIEISNNPKTENNIVRYEVISEIINNDLVLKPGMTAEVDIITSEKKDVMKVPTSALRIVIPGTAPATDRDSADEDTQTIWIMDGQGDIRKTLVRTGISDETYTEITEGDIEPGQQVITGFSRGTGDDSGSLITLPQPKRF